MSGSTRVLAPTTTVRYTRALVRIVSGPNAGVRFETTGHPVRIGTGVDNDIVLTDETVSRRHCEIEMTGEGLRVKDRGSTNGVQMGGLRIYDAVVPPDAHLVLGDTNITVTPLGAVE